MDSPLSRLPRQPFHASGPPPQEDEVSLRDLWRTLVASRWVVVGVAATAVALAGVFTALQRPAYESEATVRISEPQKGLGGLSSLALGGSLKDMAGIGGGSLKTEMATLRSRRLSELVVDSLALQVQIAHPDTPRAAILEVVSAPRSLTTVEYDLRLREDGAYSVQAEPAPAAGAPLPEKVEIGQPVRLGGLTVILKPSLRRDPPKRIGIEVRPHHKVVESTRKTLNVEQLEPGAEIIRVRYNSHDRLLAAAVPEAITRQFVAYRTETTKSDSRSYVGFLRGQVAQYEQQLAGAEAQLREFRETAQVYSPKDQATEQIRRLAEMQARRDELVGERESLDRLLSRVETESGREGGKSPYRQLAAYPVFLANGAVQNILRSLTELENERSELTVLRTAQNADVKRIDERIDDLERQLYQTARDYRGSLDSQISSAESALGRFGGELQGIPSQEVSLVRLQRRQKLLEEVYALLQTRLKEAEIEGASDPNEVDVLDHAAVPLEPVSPRPLINLALGGVLGTVLGIGLVFARRATDSKIRTRDDARGAAAGVPILGAIPRMRRSTRPLAGRIQGGGLLPARVADAAAVWSPQDPVFEAFRALRTRLSFAAEDDGAQVLVVTSALAGEGKSTCASNLANAFALQGTRTLLIDGDLQAGGGLHRALRAHRTPGLVEVLRGGVGVADAVQEVGAGDEGAVLHFMSAGVVPDDASDLIQRARIRQVLSELRKAYRVVIVDAAPFNSAADTAVLGSVADATLLVARSGYTDREALEYTVAQLHTLDIPVAGVVLNDLDFDPLSFNGYAASRRSAAQV